MSSEDTRQLFGTDGIRGVANQEPLTPETILRLGQAAALTLVPRRDPAQWPTCIIGRDTRQSGPMLESAFAAGAASLGIDVQLAGVIPTPAIARLVRDREASFGVVISASHNPFEDNGIKFFGPDGYKYDDAMELTMERLLLTGDAIAPDQRAAAARIGKIALIEDAEDAYVHSVLESVMTDEPILKGMRVALDTANGASYRTSVAVLDHLGADLVTAYDQPNGLNINTDCGATHPEAIAALVKESGAQVGISHDGDADRLILCDELGIPLDGDEILAIAARWMMKRGELKHNTVVATVMTNFGFNDLMQELGGQVLRSKVGDRYVIEEMKKGGYNLGGEQSGHLIFHDYSTTGDGIVAAIQVLQIMVAEDKPLSELRKGLNKYPQATRNLKVTSKPPVGDLLAQSLVSEVEDELGEQGRVLLRYSGTEPKIRLLIEGRDQDAIERQADQITDAILSEIGA